MTQRRRTGRAALGGLGLILGGTAMTGCAVPQVELSPLPAFTPLAFDADFQPKPESVRFTVLPQSGMGDFTQNIKHPVTLGDTIVISAPVEDGTLRARLPGQPGLTTAGYFSELEQQVERALIRKGFDLVDRAKFEAKLLAQGSKREGQLDLAELLNAAREGEVVADFVLNINRLTAVSGVSRQIDPLKYPSVVGFARRHEGLAESGALAAIEVKVVEAAFNAELIRVDTGSIAWVGTNRVTSLDLPDTGVEVTIAITPRPNNLDRLAESVRDHENELRRTHAAAALKRQQLLTGDRSLTTRDRERLSAEYERLVEQYAALEADAPRVDEGQLTYDYAYSVTMRPDFLGFFEGSGPSPEARRPHELELMRTAALEAIEQIEVRGR